MDCPASSSKTTQAPRGRDGQRRVPLLAHRARRCPGEVDHRRERGPGTAVVHLQRRPRRLPTAVLSGRETVPLFPDSLLTQGVSFTPTTPAPTPTTIDTAPQPPTRTTADTNDIRAWARANGYHVPDRGRMPVAILDAWRKAGSQ
ncbi:histone-like nucleoid-structuring protein Lsr2 [Streptomyces sp. NPDC058718]|uniref:Lsr2 family DNA-binding protein n=1 Tax=Streptomyces sp. NPDC058718 TaxID=3346610 RepID=UPI003687044E